VKGLAVELLILWAQESEEQDGCSDPGLYSFASEAGNNCLEAFFIMFFSIKIMLFFPLIKTKQNCENNSGCRD
jgi:hypothetical protein